MNNAAFISGDQKFRNYFGLQGDCYNTAVLSVRLVAVQQLTIQNLVNRLAIYPRLTWIASLIKFLRKNIKIYARLCFACKCNMLHHDVLLQQITLHSSRVIRNSKTILVSKATATTQRHSASDGQQFSSSLFSFGYETSMQPATGILASHHH